MRIFLVEDDERVASHVAKGLKGAGHMVEHMADGKEALYHLSSEVYDLVILDRMLPQVDGLKILTTMRATGDTTPVLILSALSDVDNKVKGLRAGGDDYLAKPFALPELLARVEALSRRKTVLEDVATELSIADLEMNLLTREVKRHGEVIDLTAREFLLLEYLLRNAGRVVSRSMLLEAVWDYKFDPQTNIIDQHVSRLRQKIDKDFSPALLHTVRGMGYALKV
ncbi:MAG: response regulator transcription factor [Caulobacterales bacterium]